jgi:uncharacterized protein (TIGR03000 family)
MKRTWQWSMTAAAAAVLLWTGAPVLAQRHGGHGGGHFVHGGFGVVRGGGSVRGPRVSAGGFGVVRGGGFVGGLRVPAGGFGRVRGFAHFHHHGFFAGGFRRVRTSWWVYPILFGLYTPWYSNPYCWPWPYFYPSDAPFGYPYWFDGLNAEGLDWSESSDHFAPGYAVLLTGPVTTVTRPAEGDSAVRLELAVPNTAEVWVEGVLTKQTGRERQFVSPPLEPGVEYTYNVRARWSQDRRSIDRTHLVPVRAGDVVRVDFLKPLEWTASGSDSPARQGPLNELGQWALARATR